MSKYLPVSNPTKSFWLTAEDDFATHRSTPELPTEVETLIVGSGYAGTALVHYLLEGREKPNKSILMLEARNVCSGATARNGGHLKPSLYYTYNSLKSKYGEKGAADIFNFEYAHLKAMKELIEEEEIDCDFVLTRAYDIFLAPDVQKNAIENYKEIIKNPYIKYKDDIQIKYGEEARVISKAEKSPVCFSHTAGQLWPYKLMTALLKKCVKKGVNLQTNTPVLKVEKLESGKYLVKTSRGDVITKKIIFATNAYTAAIEPKFDDKIVPIKGVCSRIVAANPKERTPHLTNTYGIRNGGSNGDYLINRPDGSVIVGGAKKHIFPYKELFYKNVDDSTVIPDTDKYFENYMKRVFYTWKNFDEKVDKVWSGILGYTDDNLPYIGEVPGDKKKFVIAGFHGHGMPRILLSAKALAKVIRGETTNKEMAIPEAFKITDSRMKNTKNEILKNLGTPVKPKL